MLKVPLRHAGGNAMEKQPSGVFKLPHPTVKPFVLTLCVLLALPCFSQAQDAATTAVAPARPVPVQAVTGRTVAEIELLLAGLTDGSSQQRREAAENIIQSIERDDVSAVRDKLLSPMPGIHIDTLRLKLVRVVTQVTAARPNAEYDLLTLLTSVPRARDSDIAIERITLARALGRIQSVEAGRALYAFSAAFNASFRQEVGRIVRGQLKDYVLPAMIEARNPSEMQRIFIRQVRDALGRVTPGDTVAQRDNALLAEILRSYGSIRHAEAMRVIVSFVNSDRAQVRDAARWAVAQYGSNARNVLRDAYEAYEGHDPNPIWSAERVALELYQAHDRRLDAEVATRLDQGIAAGRSHDVDEMLGHFRFVLARHPMFERKREMVPLLIENARRMESRNASLAERLWRLAMWVEPEGPQVNTIRSAILFLEAEQSLARGVADGELYRAALRADPNNERARDQLENVDQSSILGARRQRRVLGALGILVLASGVLWKLLRSLPATSRATVSTTPGPRKRKKKKKSTATQTASTSTEPPKATDTAPDEPVQKPRTKRETAARDVTESSLPSVLTRTGHASARRRTTARAHACPRGATVHASVGIVDACGSSDGTSAIESIGFVVTRFDRVVQACIRGTHAIKATIRAGCCAGRSTTHATKKPCGGKTKKPCAVGAIFARHARFESIGSVW
jgi:hypothetical protein